MNREIKFRAWDKILKRMIVPSEFQSKHAYMTWGGEVYENGYLQDFIMLQYTGLKDKNGKEIYEGDILSDGRNAEAVKWEAYNHAWKIAWGIGFPLIGPAERMEVIGNIYENSDLLK